MARGTSLMTLRRMLKAEVGDALTPGVATAQDGALDIILENKQKWLWAQFAWPFKHFTPLMALAAGQRYYALPAIEFDQPVQVFTRWNQYIYPVQHGISDLHYNIIDSEDAQTDDPVRRWELVDTDAGLKMEVWPIPGNAQTLRFSGTKKLAALDSDDATAELDDILIVLFCAAELLARRKQPDAQAKLAMANAHFQKLKANSQGSSRMFVMGGGAPRCVLRPTIAVSKRDGINGEVIIGEGSEYLGGE